MPNYLKEIRYKCVLHITEYLYSYYIVLFDILNLNILNLYNGQFLDSDNVKY